MSKEVEKNQVVTIENLSGSTLVNISEWEKKIADAKSENPIIEIVDNATYELQKKNRTAVKKVRTEIDKQDKVIATAFSKVRKETMEIRDSLLAQIAPFEEEHEAEVSKWETKKQREKEEREAAEQKRIDGIKAKVYEMEGACFEVINTMSFANSTCINDSLLEILNAEFDFEEFDILHAQAKSRVLQAFDDKLMQIQEKENQRLENERLARQNERLEKLYPVMAFTQGLDLMTLHELSEEDFKSLLNGSIEAKAEVDKKAEEAYSEAKRIADEREQKEREEKEKVFGIRKNRLSEIGILYDSQRDYYRHELDCYSIDEMDIRNSDTLGFEDIYNTAKQAIESANSSHQLRVKIANRVIELKNRHFTGNIDGTLFSYGDGICSTSINEIESMTDEKWANWLKIIDDTISEKLKKDDENRKASDKRQKALKKDKQEITAYVSSLEFRDAVPNVKNEESESLLKEVDERLEDFKDYIVEFIKNY